MRATLDIVLLDRQHTVVAIRPGVKPNRPVIAHPRAHSVIEMGAGFLATAQVMVGDHLRLDLPDVPEEAS
jgi:uncharacterized membrane protein (UPF0127 family)